jgi:hypothetical protein
MSYQTLITDYFQPLYKQNINNTKEYINNTNKRQRLISEYYEADKSKKQKIVYGYNSETNSWHCLTCGVDMGPQNPRQLCGKWMCPNESFSSHY